MSHFSAKKQSEQELQEILQESGFESGNYIDGRDNEDYIANATKPLYYSIQAPYCADSASIDSLTLYVIYREVASNGIQADNRTDFAQISYSLTVFFTGDEQKAEQYIESLLDSLQEYEWQYSFISESKNELQSSSKQDNTITQLVYSIDKIF